jgi:hypothetical protein
MRTKILLLLLAAIFQLTGHLSAKDKYAIGLFHFNLQYVAGDYKIERRIIRESLYPVLQFFDSHPRYRSDIEIQGYGIEVLAQEHPDVLALLKKLVLRGQIELVIAHYSDQLFIGYPALDLQRSIQLSDETLARYGLERSRVFFGQEFQYSPALATTLKGKYDVIATSSDPNSWYQGETEPLVNVGYGGDTIHALIGGGRKELAGMEWRIAFLDDGEEFNTKDYNSDFFRLPAQEKGNMDKYQKLLQDGYRFVTITELVERIKKDPGYSVPVYPFIPEGTWHMKVCGPFMWMGRQRSGVETDGITRALSYQARGEVLRAEALIRYAGQQGRDVAGLKKLLQEAWKHLLLSEVSDSSGWDPWLVEVQYTDNEVATTRKLLKDILEQLWKMLAGTGAGWIVDTGTGLVLPIETATVTDGKTDTGLPIETTDRKMGDQVLVPAALPINFSVSAQSYTVQTGRINDSLYRMDIECLRPADGAVEIAFETATDGLEYSPSCGEEVGVVLPSVWKHDPAFALTNGFIYLGNGYSLIKDCTVEHLAATWKVRERKLVFREELKEGNGSMRMRFYVRKGSAEAGLRFANRLNPFPSYRVDNGRDGFHFSSVVPE